MRRTRCKRRFCVPTGTWAEAVLLRFSADLSYEEMAAATGAGVSALKMRVKRACAQLRAMLGESIHA